MVYLWPCGVQGNFRVILCACLKTACKTKRLVVDWSLGLGDVKFTTRAPVALTLSLAICQIKDQGRIMPNSHVAEMTRQGLKFDVPNNETWGTKVHNIYYTRVPGSQISVHFADQPFWETGNSSIVHVVVVYSIWYNAKYRILQGALQSCAGGKR